MRARKSKSAPVGVVSKVLRILEVLDASPTGLQLRQIASQTAVNKSTAYRFLAHLESEGYLLRDDAGAYVAGPKLAHLGSGSTYHVTLQRIAYPQLRRVREATGETANLGILDGQTVLYLDVLESSHTFRFATRIGARRPLHCTALGKAILAHLPAAERDDLLKAMKFDRVAPNTISRLAALRKDLARTSQRGYAIDDEEAVAGACCIGVPVFDLSGKVAAAISVSGPNTRINRARINAYATIMKEAARAISSRLGYTNAVASKDLVRVPISA